MDTKSTMRLPTRLGTAVVNALTRGSIQPDWVNQEADTVYERRRKTQSRPVHTVAKLKNPATAKHLFTAAKTPKGLREAANDFRMMARASAEGGKRLQKLAASKKSPTKASSSGVVKTGTTATKTATARKKAAAKRSTTGKK
ncbi:hypothetical protein [Caballeronia sp. ATUFL_F1_KS39]|uniref:hypothetical protein n=1 Tax=Caballeronia sp. ATUFL_F1_KS39 TaxID=2921766 RepID=UPI002028BF2C|nr:hypothetical protein [Caballeronia sp. ATUFL_F1_KS39]